MHEYSISERRLTLRLLAYWEKMRGMRDMPVENDINPEDIMDLWDYCFLIHVADLKQPDYSYIYLGNAIINAYQQGLPEVNPSGVVSLRPSTLAKHYEKVIATAKPVVEEGEFLNLVGHTVKYRQCLLPLGEYGQVNAIFGGMRFKISPS